MDEKLKAIIDDALYDTFCGYFHPDEWKVLLSDFWKQVKQNQCPDCASIITDHIGGDNYRCEDCGLHFAL